jgi:hypothetical protein
MTVQTAARPGSAAASSPAKFRTTRLRSPRTGRRSRRSVALTLLMGLVLLYRLAPLFCLLVYAT